MMEFRYKEEDLKDLKRVVVITGPTAVGKTELSLRIAEELGGEIVSADSLQVYRYLDIGTAKATREEQERVPHHLIDVVDPDEEFNAGDYGTAAHLAMEEIFQNDKIPILVGGTGLYLRLLIHGLVDLPESDPEIRKNHQRIASEQGVEPLYTELQAVDEALAKKIHPNDLIRISRGLEVYEQTGKALSAHQEEHKFKRPNYHALKLALIRPREELYNRINLRVEKMFTHGLIEEYQSLLERGYGRELKPMRSVGYKEVGDYLLDGKPLEESIDEVKRRTRRYAKQQLSWFRGEPQTHWALAPLIEEKDGKSVLPPRVKTDVEEFLRGGTPRLEWAKVEPYNVSRD